MIPRDVIARFGFADSFIIACSRLLQLISRSTIDISRYYLFSQPLELKGARPRKAGSLSAVRSVAAGDALLQSFPRPITEIADRFASGALCFAFEADGKALGFAWFQRGDFLDAEVHTVFRPQPHGATVWDFDVYVDPAKRGGLVFFRLWQDASRSLLEQGVTHSVSRVLTHNEDSIRSHMSLGAFPVGSVVQLRVGKARLSFADRAPRVSLSMGKRNAPTLAVPAGVDAKRDYSRFKLRAPTPPA